VTEKEKMPKTNRSIYYAEDNSQYIVKSTPDLGILKSLGIVENARIQKLFTHRLGGPVLVRVGSSEIAIGKDIAEKIMVGGK